MLGRGSMLLGQSPSPFLSSLGTQNALQAVSGSNNNVSQNLGQGGYTQQLLGLPVGYEAAMMMGHAGGVYPESKMNGNDLMGANRQEQSIMDQVNFNR